MTGGSQRHPGGWAKRLATGIVTMVAECHRAQRKMVVLASSPDRYLLDVGVAPGTYQEFLFRTSGALMHEPPAYQRLAGRGVR
jgi:hypothetical protein